jgi:hypothetical protein
MHLFLHIEILNMNSFTSTRFHTCAILKSNLLLTLQHQPYIKKYPFPKTLLNAQPKKLKVTIIIQIKLFKITTYSHFTSIYKCNHKY